LSATDFRPGSAPDYHFPNAGYPYFYSGYDWVFKANNRFYRAPLMTLHGEKSEDILVSSDALPEEYRYNRHDRHRGIPLDEAIQCAIDRSPLPLPQLLTSLTQLLSFLAPDKPRCSPMATSSAFLSSEAEALGFTLSDRNWTLNHNWECSLWWLPGNKFCGRFHISWNATGWESILHHTPHSGRDIYSHLALHSISGAPLSFFQPHVINALSIERKRRELRRIARRAKRPD
jgi:hypothetical protein